MRRPQIKIVIIGGGYLGQLIQFMLPEARCLDWRTAAGPSSRGFGAQYLWSPIPGLEHRTFPVITHVDGRNASEPSILAYKKKVGKEQDASDWRPQFAPTMQGYEIVTMPPDRVEYGMRVDRINRDAHTMRMANGEVIQYDWVISTIPLPSLIDLCGLSQPADVFESRPIFVGIDPKEYPETSYWRVNYIADPASAIYRETFRDGHRHVESLQGMHDMEMVRLLPGKIYKHSQTSLYRAELMTERILTVGRYGSWNPEELAHETLSQMRDWKDRMFL